MSQLHLALIHPQVNYRKIRPKFKSLDVIATGGGSSLFSKSIEGVEKYVGGDPEAGKVTHMSSVKNYHLLLE